MWASIRFRLTLWYTAVLAVVLVVFAAGTFFWLARSLRAEGDAAAAATTRAFVANLAEDSEDRENPSLPAAVVDAARELDLHDRSLAVYDSAGSPVASSGALGRIARAPAELAPLFRRAREGGREPVFASFPEARGVRAVALAARVHGLPYTVVVFRRPTAETEVLERLRHVYTVSIPLALLLAGLGGYLLARRALAPVSTLRREAARIGAENLDTRFPVGRGDELGHLAATFNELLDRLAGAFEQQRRFMADASHELRTPVAIVRGEAEVVLSREERSVAEYRESLGVIHEEARRLSRIVEDLFTLARADAGRHPLLASDFYLDELLGECVRAYRSLAADRGISLLSEPGEESPFRGDEGLLRRMILNLVDNAAKHTPPGGTVRLALRREDGAYRVTVADTGSGISPEALPHVFERFYRADAARSRADGGAGLGLPIARWIAQAHGGTLRLESTGAEGSVFALTLPAQPPRRG